MTTDKLLLRKKSTKKITKNNQSMNKSMNFLFRHGCFFFKVRIYAGVPKGI